MADAMPNAEVRDAAIAALNWLYRDPPLRIQPERLTVDAAQFAFKALIRVDKASRLGVGLFRLWSPLPAQSWMAISLRFVRAAKDALKDPNRYERSLLGSVVAGTQRRLLQAHLDDPDTFPCPDFR